MVYPIIVGVDGSEPSRNALDWAADEAVERGLPLRIVHAWLWRPYDAPPIAPPAVSPAAVSLAPGDREWHERSQKMGAQKVLGEAAARVRERSSDLEVTTGLVHHSAGPALCDESAEASMVVLGSRGHGGFAGLLLGSVSLYVAGRAECPVVVVRALSGQGRGPELSPEILLGVDGHMPCQKAIEFAFEEAALRGAVLHVLYAWTHPRSHPKLSGHGVAPPLVYDPQEVGRDEARLLSEVLAGWLEKFPEVDVVQEVWQDSPGKALVARSAQADLLVVGAHRRRSRLGLNLGRVNHTVLHHAHCPAAVVPER